MKYPCAHGPPEVTQAAQVTKVTRGGYPSSFFIRIRIRNGCVINWLSIAPGKNSSTVSFWSSSIKAMQAQRHSARHRYLPST